VTTNILKKGEQGGGMESQEGHTVMGSRITWSSIKRGGKERDENIYSRGGKSPGTSGSLWISSETEGEQTADS